MATKKKTATKKATTKKAVRSVLEIEIKRDGSVFPDLARFQAQTGFYSRPRTRCVPSICV